MNDSRLLRNPIGFLLLPRFTVIALSSAIEPLRIANRYAATKYVWRLISMDGAPVPDGNGLQIQPDCSIERAGALGTLLVCADHDPEKPVTRRLAAWLRALDHAGTTLGGVDTGAFTLARAGLLKGRRVTVHWEVVDVFRERYPGIEVTQSLFEADRGRLTCAGGVAVIDMMLHAIAADHGQAIAARVAEHCLHDHMRNASELQRMTLAPGAHHRNAKLLAAIRHVESRLDTVTGTDEIARQAGLSTRQLARLFRTHLGESPARYMLRLRLERSRQLLRRTAMPVVEVAIACGFVSQAHFSRRYQRMFGCAPRDERRALQPGRMPVMDSAKGVQVVGR